MTIFTHLLSTKYSICSLSVFCGWVFMAYGAKWQRCRIFYSASPKWWAILTVYLLILKPTSLLLALFTRQWREPGMNSTSLQNAGQWIGYLERCLILTFILVGFNEAIGFLLAAKSIFRFGELSKGQEIKTTEYVLIGTLASFTIAILTGLVLRTFLSAYT